MVIGGEHVPAADGQVFDVVSPVNGAVIARVPRGGAEDVDRAVVAAQRAFDGEWHSWSQTRRGQTLARFAALIRDHLEELAATESRNMGKPISSARWEIGAVANVMEYYAGAANKLMGETIPVSKPGFDFTLREPIGVVGLIVPWNFPLMLASWKMGPALAAGNTAILKPASYTPLTAIRVAELALEAGFPPGVLNVVTGPGAHGRRGDRRAPRHRQGRLHRRDRHGAGDHASGRGQHQEGQPGARRQEPQRRLRRRGHRTLRRRIAVLRLRQLRPGLLRPVPHHRRALRPRQGRGAVRRGHAARSRSATRPTRPPKSARWSASASARPSSTTFESGARRARDVVVGGGIPTEPAFAQGAYIEPTVLDRVTSRMRIAQEEVFGPVVVVIPFDTEEEAIRLANDTPYGLSGSIWTRDIGKAIRTAKGIQSGVISVNCNSSVHAEAPFGGYKMSGMGRENGMHAFESYTQVKNVYVDLS